MLTKERIGAALAIVAGVVGLVLVLNGAPSSADEDDDDGPATPGPTTSQVAPAPGGQIAPPAPGQQTQPAAPTPTKKDDDGDDDDDDG